MFDMRIVAIIPAHMASVRFPGKILHPFYGLPMIEHVRRRALLSSSLDDVFVATCDEAIASVIRGFGGKVIMTANTHKNGTTRVAEAIEKVDCTHVILLQGDEPLLLPRHVDALADAMRLNPDGYAWNATGPIKNQDELDRHSFVKCAIGSNSRILFCFRRSPCYSSSEKQQDFVRKILGIIAYKKEFLLDLTKLPPTEIEQAEFIEQMRIIENGYELSSTPLSPSLPSVNEPSEVEIVLDYIQSDGEQKRLLDEILSVAKY
jgi:3-deoxy-manno-octulosonate cytidylyltransferase (CMP-KDO synthetase)